MVTLKELSKLLHISVSTVSKALNDSPEIGDITKKRVKELAEQLNYKPNRLAQQLRSNKTKTIGVVIPTLINPFFAEVVYGIESYATKQDYDIIISLTEELIFKEKRSLKLLSSGSVDGFIISASMESQTLEDFSHLEDLNKNKIPFVMFDRVIDALNCSKVVVDDFKSVYEATNHLIEKENRKHIALISTIQRLNVGQLRTKGYTKALEENGFKPLILELDEVEELDVAILEFLKENPKIDAIVSIDHITGISASNMISELNKNVPENISVIGFGYNATHLVSRPKLSTIQQRAYEVGESAAELLINQLKDEEFTKQNIIIPSGLELNETTKAS